MFFKQIILIGAIIPLAIKGLYAQQDLMATGGDIKGIGGSVSYSIGQVVNNSLKGSNNYIIQGVQQPYEISNSIGINETSISIELSVYPNPTSNVLVLSISHIDELTYQLTDMNGTVLQESKISSNKSQINMEPFKPAIYFLVVSNNYQIVKSLKIIKNE